MTKPERSNKPGRNSKPATPLKRAEQIAQTLRRRIVRGELRGGEHLPIESELIAQFGVSRPTLRAALRILESESLIQIVNGSPKGPRVQMPSPQVAAQHVGLILQSRNVTLADVYTMRLMVEPLAVRILAGYSHPLTISALNAVIAEERRAIDDAERFGDMEVRFHETLFEHTGNQTLMLVFELLHAIFERHMKSFNIHYAARPDAQVQRKKSLAAQTKLVGLIKTGDVQAAESFWSLHLEKAAKFMLQDRELERVVDLLG
jgi:DNA-binding FadR family transcriptional regulator